ncbi:MAG TPA: trypsin-like peptidase domain-containing protein [Anaerolineaceae bacterium]|nr:trypsin-like peptidase domain-containing protein [Anaerolineaceae bacterium]
MKNQKLSVSIISLFVVLSMAACGAAQASGVSPLLPAASAAENTQALATLPEGLTPSEQVLVALYETVNPSVVNIRVVMKADAVSTDTLTIPNMPEIPGLPNQQDIIPSQGQGSGFVYDQNGYIVTNNHVVENAERIIVTFYDGSEAEASLVGTDPGSDLAVIKVDVDPSMLTPVVLGDADTLKVGQSVVAIGNPFGLQNSMSTGIVSGLGRMLATSGSYSIPDMIQTDTAINPGNSGGPLLNLQGQVIGVNTAIESQVRQSSGVGYAVPVSLIKLAVPEMIANGKVEHAWLGISGTTLNADLTKAMDLDAKTRGVLVAEVVKDSPAEKAGLKGSSTSVTVDGIDRQIGGDIITSIDGRPVKVFDDLLGYVFTHTRPGDTVTLSILRDGKQQEVKVTVEARP